METLQEIIVKAALMNNFEQHKKELNELLTVYELAELGRSMFDARCDDVIDRVLAEHKFYVGKEFKESVRTLPMKQGDRVTSHDYEWLLSEEDFGRLYKLARPIMVAEKLTDENGYFTENWSDMVCDARNKVFDFICQNIMPEAIRERFYRNRWNVRVQEKVINVMKGAYKEKEAV